MLKLLLNRMKNSAAAMVTVGALTAILGTQALAHCPRSIVAWVDSCSYYECSVMAGDGNTCVYGPCSYNRICWPT